MASFKFKSTSRWCMVCDVPLVTAKHYIRLNSSKVIRTGLQEQFEEFFEDVGLGIGVELTEQYVCDKCVGKVKNASKLKDLRLELQEKYKATRVKHSTSSANLTTEEEAQLGSNSKAKRPPSSSSRSLTLTPSKQGSSSVATASTPVKTSGAHPKRHAAFSPGTPSSKHQSKKHLASSSGIGQSPVGLAFGKQDENQDKYVKASSESQPQSKKLLISAAGTGQSQKRLAFGRLDENQDKSAKASPASQVIFHDQSGSRRRALTDSWNSVASSLSLGNEVAAIRNVLAMDEAQKEIASVLKSRIQQEVAEICRPAGQSAFRRSSIDDIVDFNLKQQELELQQTTPTFLSMLQTAAEAQHLGRNVQKTKESLLPRVMTAASILLNSRSQRMNSHQVLNSLTLKEGAAKKSTFKRMNARGVCSSYDTALKMQLDCGKNYDSELKLWADEVHRGHDTERTLEAAGDIDALTQFNASRDAKGYQLVMDNVDVVVKARHPTRENYGKDYHMVQMMAVQNRVSAWHLPNSHPIATIDTIESTDFLPNTTDNNKLKRDWTILSARMIREHIPALCQMMDTLPHVIVHEHMTEMKEKSKVVNLGVLMENENTSNGILKIMHHMHAYVPGHSSEHPTTIISAGDLLTCERESNCIEQQRNSSTPSQRLEGLMPVIADFHAIANFYQIIWKHLYDASSAADTGTLYSARNYLQARSVTTNPMANINAAADLLQKYTTALVLVAAMDFFGLEDLAAEPTRHLFSLDQHGDIKHHAECTMAAFVETYMLPTEAELNTNEQEWRCTYCSKRYASRKALLKHEKSKHPGSSVATVSQAGNCDSVYNYSKCALAMGMLAHDFNNARQMGDGDRIILLYKFMLLHCRAANKPKYSYQMLRLLAQVKCFLSPRLSYELVWNRCVNTKGKEGCNVEVDRSMEHRNRIFQDNCHGLHGHITQQSIDRVSRSAQIVHDVLTTLDGQLQAKKASSKRQETGKQDVASLAKILHDEHIFEECPGRKHSKFPDFPVNVLCVLQIPDLHKWISTTLKSLSRQNMFQHI